VKRAELVTTIEVPKWDIQKWREQRDILVAGEIINETLQHLESMSTRGQDMQVRTVTFNLENSTMELNAREIM
jgi:hypothetical protein